MTDHLEVLRRHNAWRRGEIDDNRHSPNEIGQAIDAAIAECEIRRYSVETLQQVVTGDFETKEAFIARVRAVMNGEVASG